MTVLFGNGIIFSACGGLPGVAVEEALDDETGTASTDQNSGDESASSLPSSGEPTGSGDAATPDSSQQGVPNSSQVDSSNADVITSVEITSPERALFPGEATRLSAVARNAQGGEVAAADLTFRSFDPGLATVTADGGITAVYPGEVLMTATAAGITSVPWRLTVNPAPNGMNVRRLTDNAVDDSWGPNNTWKTTARGHVLWLESDDFDPAGSGRGGAAAAVVLGETDGTVLMREDAAGLDVDFMALGGGKDEDDVLAAWREDLAMTVVSDGAVTADLGDHNQEENSIANGCLFFRDSTDGPVDNSVAAFRSGAALLGLVGDAGGDDHDPVASGPGCQAAWIRDGALIHFDGTASTVAAAGPFVSRDDFDFRGALVVYASGGDVFALDVSVSPFAAIRLADDGPTVDDAFPRTDGRSVVWVRGGAEVMLWDGTGTAPKAISSGMATVTGGSLQIDGKQVVWQEGADTLFFHEGSGDVSGTSRIDPFPATGVLSPYLADGRIAWFGQSGTGTDTEIFVLE